MTRPARKTKVSFVKVVPLGPRSFKVISDPHPIHHAFVKGSADGVWRVTFPTEMAAPSLIADTYDSALRRASVSVGKLAGRDLDRFTRAQAYAMCQQRCPKLLGGATCDETPEVGTIWCRWHPGGKVGYGTL